MKWYEITGIVVVWVIGIYVRGKFYESMRDYFYKDNRRNRRKK